MLKMFESSPSGEDFFCANVLHLRNGGEPDLLKKNGDIQKINERI